MDTDVEIIEACDTDGDHPALESEGVQAMMSQIWTESYGTESNPLPHDQRNEAMIMVLATSSGYETEIIPPGPNTSSCEFDFNNFGLPSNIVALIHTHPYSDNIDPSDPRCPDGVTDTDDVSPGDRAVVEFIRDDPVLPAIPMFVMDPVKIRIIDPSDPSEYDSDLNRCGYLTIDI